MRDAGLNPRTYETSWFWRRLVLFCTLIFSAGMLTYLAGWGRDTKLNEAIATGILLLDSVLIPGYFGFATLDDRSRRSSYVSYRSTVLERTGKVDDPDA